MRKKPGSLGLRLAAGLSVFFGTGSDMKSWIIHAIMASTEGPYMVECKPYNAGRAQMALLLFVLAAAVLAVYLPVLKNGYVWDDEQYIVSNPWITGGLSLQNARWASTSFYAGNWHPLTWLSHQLDVTLFGTSPKGAHFVNLLLHLASSLLLLTVLRQLTGSLCGSFLVATLFALHPLHVESVAWAAERKDLLAGLFFMLTLLAYAWYVRRPVGHRYAFVVLSLAVGLLAKPMLVTLPPLLLLLDFWPLGRLARSSWRKPIWEKVPLLPFVLASSAVTILAQRSGQAFSYNPFAIRLGNALLSSVRYLEQMIYPRRLAFFYPFAWTNLPATQLLASALALAVVTVACVAWWRSRPWFGMGWCWYLGMLLPVIGLVQVGSQARADRYTYLPLIGVFVMIASTLGEIVKKYVRLKATTVALSVFVLVALALTASSQLRTWRDEESLFGHAIAVTRDNWMAHFLLGRRLANRDDLQGALVNYREALRLNPRHSRSHNNLGVLLSRTGRRAEAIAEFQAAIMTADYPYADPYNNLGAIYADMGRSRDSERNYLEALNRCPDCFTVHLNLGNLLIRERRFTEAADHLRAATRIDPGSASAHNDLGVALGKMGHHGEAAEEFRRASTLNPSNVEIQENLRRALAPSAN